MKHLFLTILFSVLCLPLLAQADRDFVRRGNRFMRDSLYEKAQVEYQKAIEADNTSSLAHYNLGNALLHQSKPEDAMKEYEIAIKMEKNPQRLAHIYHNMGTLLQSSKQLDKAIACYKNALRNNPHADDTRYNYLLCLRQQKEGGDNQDQQQDQQGEDEKKEQDQQQQDKQDKENPDKQDQKEQDTPKPDPEQMSKENAEQMLQAAMQNEKETQEKIQQAQQQPQRKRLQKQW